MRHTARILPVCLCTLMLLVGCKSEPSEPKDDGGTFEKADKADPAPTDLTGCAPDGFDVQSRLGTPVSDIDVTGPDGRRIIRPGQMVTMDYLAGRLNLVVDDAGNLTRAYCG